MNTPQIEKLEELIKIHCVPGTINYSPHMYGMAIGLICALACMKGEDAVYPEKPAEWMENKPPYKEQQTPLTAEQMHALGCEIIAGMHAEIRGGDMEYGRAAQQADLQLPSAEELATEGYTEVPEWAHKTVEHNRQRLSKQAAFISEVAIKKLMELSPDVCKAPQLRQELEKALVNVKHTEQTCAYLRKENEAFQCNVASWADQYEAKEEELEQMKEQRDELSKWVKHLKPFVILPAESKREIETLLSSLEK